MNLKQLQEQVMSAAPEQAAVEAVGQVPGTESIPPADDAQEKLKLLLSQYGSAFNNNQNVAMMILNRLQEKGIDVSAAEDAVKTITDQLRLEASNLLNDLQQKQQQAEEVLDKVTTVQETVDAALAAKGQPAPSEEAASAPAPAPAAEPAAAPAPEPASETEAADNSSTGGPTPEAAPSPDVSMPPVNSDVSLKDIAAAAAEAGELRDDVDIDDFVNMLDDLFPTLKISKPTSAAADEKAFKVSNRGDSMYKPSNAVLSALMGA